MIKYLTICCQLLLVCVCSTAQPKQDLQSIKSLCGCFEVDFRYAETFSPDKNYKFDKPYHTGGLEWVTAEESSDQKWVIQHLLVASDSMIIKHWREDWEYEKKDWWLFAHDATWNHVTTPNKNVSGQWTQTVWEVDDAPRYQGSGTWIANNGRTYWENTTDAPLPRREYTKRSDYNVMERTNRIIITDTGWVHEQDNNKIVRKDGAPDKLVAQEKGYNVYRKVDDSRCAAAAGWWAGHRQFWSGVRQAWAGIMKDKTSIRLVQKADGKFLYQQLDNLEAQGLADADLRRQAGEMLLKYIDDAGKKGVASNAPASK